VCIHPRVGVHPHPLGWCDPYGRVPIGCGLGGNMDPGGGYRFAVRVLWHRWREVLGACGFRGKVQSSSASEVVPEGKGTD